jgi:hypothetical protein
MPATFSDGPWRPYGMPRRANGAYQQWGGADLSGQGYPLSYPALRRWAR